MKERFEQGQHPHSEFLVDQEIHAIYATILVGQLDDVGGQPLFIVTALRNLTLRRTMLAERRIGAALGDGQLPSNMLDAGAAARGA